MSLESYSADFLKARNGLAAHSGERAKAEITFRNLDALTKHILAKAYMSSDQKTVGGKEQEAYASPAHELHLTGLNIAREKFIQSKAKEDVCKAEFDYAQSMISLEKAFITIR